MQRYFVSEWSNEIKGPDAHHIKHVMRMKTDDEIIICYEGHCFLSTLTIDQDHVYYEKKHELDHQATPHITLIQGLPKHPKGETVVKYATLFGASMILFVPMSRSIAKPDNEANKHRRMALIAKEASELSHRFDVPKIAFELSLKQIQWATFTQIILADENEKTVELDQAIPHVDSTDKIALIIGPEGGITDQERSYLQSIGAKAVSLGPRILPTELASLYALTYLSLKNTKTF